MMQPGENYFTFNLVQKNATHFLAEVIIDSKAIDSIYKNALTEQKSIAQTQGFSKGDTPIYYIEHNYKPHIISHLQEFFFTHCVINFLTKALHENKILLVGDFVLTDIKINPGENGRYTIVLPNIVIEKEEKWRKLTLKAPARKNYKDLDRQVEHFIKEEEDKAKSYETNTINYGDWVFFEFFPVDKETKQPLLKNYKEELWIKISSEEADIEIQQIFLNKKVGDSIYTQSIYFQEYLSSSLHMNYLFCITVKDYVPFAYFSFEQFKRHFQLKSPKEVHLKLIEVFSFRNDISQRRETIEAACKLLSKNYILSLPKQILERQRQHVLEAVHSNPDYHVYKAQTDFKDKIKLLAEKQLKESIIIDTIAFQDNIEVCHDDVISYINLIKRPRTKEFIYFNLPSTRLNGQEIPISSEVLKQYVKKEKTLNQIINLLTKKIN